MKITAMARHDAGAVAKLLKSEFGRDYAGYVSFTPAYVLRKAKEKGNTFFAARDGKAVVGFCRLSKVDLDLAELRWTVVSRGRRREGIGTELIGYALARAKKRGIRKIVLRTRAKDTASNRLSRKLGFRKEGRFKDHFRRGTDIVQWAKFLRA